MSVPQCAKYAKYAVLPCPLLLVWGEVMLMFRLVCLCAGHERSHVLTAKQRAKANPHRLHR